MQAKTNEKLNLSEINKAVQVIKEGGIVIFPTDTVYGIGCRFDNESSKARIKKIKKSNQNFPVLVSDIKMAVEIADLNQQATELAKKYWPGALTLIVKAKKGDSIGLRIPDSKICITLLKKAQVPIIGTSANFHTKPAPKSYQELEPALISQVDFVLKGKCKNKQESTVIDTTVNPYKIIRRGAIEIK